jgi:DNA-binding Xre family transcriptional regulator
MVKNCRVASRKGLEAVDIARDKLGWNKIEEKWYEKASVSEPTLKRFWQRAKIRRDNFDKICEVIGVNPDEVCETELSPYSATEMEIAVLDNSWVGREILVEELLTRLQNSTRILLLLGITGIGKTALAEYLVVQLRGQWQELRENWENETRPRDFITVATNWLTAWGEKVSNIQNDPEQLLNKLVDKLCKGNYLLLLDSLEYLLVDNPERGWGDFADPWWGKLWKSLLSTPTYKSRIIITSQDFPVQLATDCGKYPKLWHQQVLSGLNTEEQINLFKKLELLSALETDNSKLTLIGSIYDGHPLALRVIAGEIKESYQGNIQAYWRKNSSYIEEVQQALEEAKKGNIKGVEDRWQLDSYTSQLRLYVKQRIVIAFQRLQEQVSVAHELISVASIYRCEVPEHFWLSHLEMEGYELTERELAMRTLRDRFLVEDCGFDDVGERLVAQHNLIRSVAIAQRLEFYNADE